MPPLSSTIELPPPSKPRDGNPLPFVVALRAVAALLIVGHHFAIYPPWPELAAPLLGGVLDWLAQHARTTQVFFVVGGYVMARSMSRRAWRTRQVGGFIAQRYLRLGLPYLATIALILPLYAFARGWLPEEVIGAPVSLLQVLAHLFFLQGVLGYEQLSAGLWFVCINFQLCLVYAACLWLRDNVGARRTEWMSLLGWPLAVWSLFHVNLDPALDNTWLYFFPYFFMGVLVFHGLRSRSARIGFWLYQLVLIAAMVQEWRWRLAVALVVGVVLFVAERSGVAGRWPNNRVVARLGEVSFSLFLIHFPVLVFISTVWARLGWTSPAWALGGLAAAFVLSIAAAFAFHRWVELPAARLARGRQASPARAAAPAWWGLASPAPAFVRQGGMTDVVGPIQRRRR